MNFAELLEQRLKWMKKFLHHSNRFAEMQDFDSFDLEQFERNRNSLVKIIDALDKKIGAHPILETKRFSAQITYYVEEKSRILKEILVVDDAIMKKLENARQDTKEKLKEINLKRRALSRYRSSDGHSEKLDKTI